MPRKHVSPAQPADNPRRYPPDNGKPDCGLVFDLEIAEKRQKMRIFA